jgi:hypothetical protein
MKSAIMPLDDASFAAIHFEARKTQASKYLE